MNILMLAMSMGIGGAETHVLTLARAYSRAGHRVRVASAGGVLCAELEKAGIAHTGLPLDRKSPFAVLRSAAGVLRLCRRERFDAVHAHGRIPAYVAGLCRRLCRLSVRPFPPVTVTVHGICSPDAPGARHSYWGDCTVAVSSDVADYTAATYGLARESIAVIPNGVELCPVAGVSRDRSEFRIVSASRLDRDSAAAALELCRVLPDLCREFPGLNITLTVVGGGGMSDAVRAAADSANGELGRRAAVCVGATVRAPEISATAELFVGTSRAALEAMAAGVPVLLSGDAGTQGLLTPENLDAAAQDNLTCRRSVAHGVDSKALLYSEMRRFMLMSDAERTSLGAFCRDAAEKYFDIDLTAGRTAAVLRSAAEKARGGILLCGYYGASNAGDDASLAAVSKGLSGLLPQAYLGALTRGEDQAGLLRDVKAIPAFSPMKIKKALRRSRLLLLGGGSLLQDSTSLRSLVYYAGVVRAAKRAGCKIAIWGGAGPLRRKISRRIAAGAVRSADLIFARDDDAAKTFAALGGREVRSSADPAWLTAPEPPPARFYEEYGVGRDFFAIAPRPTAQLCGCGGSRAEEAAMTALADFAFRMHSERGLLPVLCALSPEDGAVCRRIEKKLERRGVRAAYLPNGTLTPGGLAAFLGGARFVVAERLHAALFAVLGGGRTVPVDCDPKVAGFASRINEAAIPFGRMTAERLCAAAEDILSSGNEKNSAVGTQKSSASETLSEIAELYGR